MNQQNFNQPRFGQQPSQQYSMPPSGGIPGYTPPSARRGLVDKMFGAKAGRMMKSPLMATAAILLCGVAVSGVLMSFSGDDANVPVIEADADALAYRQAPSEPGGMDIQNRDSSVYAAIDGQVQQETTPVENLLGETADKAETLMEVAEADVEAVAEAFEPQANEDGVEDFTPLAETETPPVMLQKIVKAEKEAVEAVQKSEMQDAQVAVAETPAAPKSDERPEIVYKPGENPETLEFVKSVLQKKDGRAAYEKETDRRLAETASASDVAMNISAVKPASGTPSAQGTASSSATHYIQLGSVRDMAGAEKEWGRLQKQFTAELGASAHRVQQADLGERGVFYRIQAGPFAKGTATDLCESIKAQKPGACLVVQ